MMKKMVLLTLLAAMFAVSASTAIAATCSVSDTAPEINSLDIANYAASTGLDKWWVSTAVAGYPKGQTFTTGTTQSILKAITYEISDTQSAEVEKTYVIRLSTINKVDPGDSSTWVLNTFYSETAKQSDIQWIGTEKAVSTGVDAAPFMSWTFDSPVLLDPATEYAIDIGITNSTSGWTTGIPYIKRTGDEYPGGTRYMSKAVTNGVGDTSMNNVSGDMVFHLDIDDLLEPTPTDGQIVDAGDVTLRWTNIDPNDGYPVIVDVWYGSDPDTDFAKVVDAVSDANNVTVSAPVAGTYYWQVTMYFGGTTAGDSYTSPMFKFIVIDTDGDGLPDDYELEYTGSATAMNAGDDLEPDGLDNITEFQIGTNPVVVDTDGDTLGDGDELNGTAGDRPATDPLLADTDGDGVNDGAESNTGIYVSSDDTGTDPINPDSDGDGYGDGVETNTGVFVDVTDTGTNPLNSDSDADGAGDWYEIAASYTDPTNPAELPNVPYPLPDFDPCDVPAGFATKPVKVYIMSGQSNMVGFGNVNGTAPGTLETIVKRENKFPNMIDDQGAWTTRDDVYYRGVISDIGNGKLNAVVAGTNIGPEMGFGQVMGYHYDEPILLIKSSIGNRSLNWDVAPPSTQQFEYDGYTYAGYGDSPNRWETGTTPEPINWYCGYEWDRFFLNEADFSPSAARVGLTNVINAYDILENFAAEYPQFAAQGFEIAGFVWWQGHKDGGEQGTGTANIHATRYEMNMTNFINDIRAYYESRFPNNIKPNAPFVVATVGFSGGNWEAGSSADTIHAAQMAVGDPQQHPEFAGNVASVDTTGYWRDSSISPTGAGYHYNHNAETYMLVGDALGRAMIELDAAFPVDAGENMVTWSGEPVEMNPVVDLDPNVTNETYTWTAVSTVEGTVVDFSDAGAKAPTVTITKPEGEMAVVTLTLTVDDGENPPVRNSVAIEVYDDACKAGLGMGLDEDHPTDIVGDDCITNLEDLAALAARWLDNKGLSEPMHKPAE